MVDTYSYNHSQRPTFELLKDPVHSGLVLLHPLLVAHFELLAGLVHDSIGLWMYASSSLGNSLTGFILYLKRLIIKTKR